MKTNFFIENAQIFVVPLLFFERIIYKTAKHHANSEIFFRELCRSCHIFKLLHETANKISYFVAALCKICNNASLTGTSWSMCFKVSIS